MKFSNIIHELLLLEYSNKIINQLVNKFKEESPNLPPNIIIGYINRFKDIKNNPKVTQKDITKYTWKELETVVDANQPKRIKVGKINDAEPSNDSNLIYNENGLRIYQANSKKSCIKYGNGYSFCISARGDNNMFNHYRFAENGTPYFIFDDSKTSDKDENDNFIDPSHVLVLFNYVDDTEIQYYTITDANNEGDEDFISDPWNDAYDKITKKYPKLKGLKNLFKNLPTDDFEKKIYRIEKKYDTLIWDLITLYNDDVFSIFPSLKRADNYIDDVLSGKKIAYIFNAYFNDDKSDGYVDEFFAGNKNEYDKKYNEHLKKAKKMGNIMSLDVKKIDLNDPKNDEFLESFNDIKKLVDKYRNELSKIKFSITDTGSREPN